LGWHKAWLAILTYVQGLFINDDGKPSAYLKFPYFFMVAAGLINVD
jgi:hypothetical protein